MSRNFHGPALACAAVVAAMFWPSSLEAQEANGTNRELERIRADIVAIQGKLRSLDSGLKALQDTAHQNSRAIGDLERTFQEEFIARMTDLHGIIDQISMQTPQGTFVPTLGQVQINQPFGKVVVRNQMSTPQFVTVNDQQRWVQPMGGVEEFSVRPGMVRTTLPGFEGPKSWHIGPGNGYRAEIEIVPRQ